MATLVLTVVGGVIGGPVGAAIGATLGQAIDRDVIFRPKGRQGPRLSDLAVQTSSYGTMIPKVFGTMRVAGCVIWSTDLIESRSTQSGGKGQPSTTTYSYAASFAVLLSARTIRGVGRIWAEGKLLRGSAGDFKSATGFRLHLGGEDQSVDPLIASAEGAGACPAVRGMAYAVFENLQLADYGNRIPSLTFELIADPAPVTMGAVAAELSGGLVTGAGPALAGFSAYGDSVRGMLETLADASGGWFAADGDALALCDAATPVAMLDDAGCAAGDARPGRTRSNAPNENPPPPNPHAQKENARDYQTGVQRAQRSGAGARETRIDLPAVLGAVDAKALAERALARAEAGRERRTIRPGWTAMATPPGACVTIADAPGAWRVTGWTLEAMALAFDCVRLAPGSAAPASASSGRVSSAPDVAIGTTILHGFEMPPLDDALLQAPRLSIVAAGSALGWRAAALLYSLDDGASWVGAGATAAPGVIGAIVTPPGPASAAIRDLRSTIEIVLAHDGMTLAGADDAALDRGANVALVGDELLQFGSAEQIGPARWRLSRLLRGRRGTEAAIGTQAAGDRFVRIEADTVRTIDLPVAAIGGAVRVMASGVGDGDGPVSAIAAITGASVLPPSPVHLRRDGAADGAVALRWIRRSRAGWRWIDGVDAPLAEDGELYRLTVREADGTARVIETDTPTATIPAAAGATIAVRQAGTFGESAAASTPIT